MDLLWKKFEARRRESLKRKEKREKKENKAKDEANRRRVEAELAAGKKKARKAGADDERRPTAGRQSDAVPSSPKKSQRQHGASPSAASQRHARYARPGSAPAVAAEKARKRDSFPMVEKPGRARSNCPPKRHSLGHEQFAYRRPRADRNFSVDSDDPYGNFDEFERKFDNAKNAK